MNMKRIIAFIAAVLFAASLASCGRELPPDDGTPAPAPLDGVYSCGGDTLTFNGDGQSITLDITEEFASSSGLPAGRSEGTYVFLFANGSWRRDKAEDFRVTVSGENYIFLNALGVTDEDTVAVNIGGAVVRFEKTGG